MTVQRIGGDSIYGNGADGTVIINSNISLSRDMYYANLTVSSGRILNTNGYKIFVKDNLQIEGWIINTGNSNTVSGMASIGSGNITHSVGGNASGNVFTASQLNDGQKSDIITLITGVVPDTALGFRQITGGAGGQNGTPGTVTANTAGGAGTLNRNPLVAGGPGTPGVAVTVSAGGAGGKGGGVIIISARNIFGSGTVSATGEISLLGESAKQGANGNAAPTANLTYHTDNQAHYRTGDGVHGPHTTVAANALPHGGHVGAAQNTRNQHRHVSHHVGNVHHTGGGHVGGHYDHGPHNGPNSGHIAAYGHTHTDHDHNAIPHVDNDLQGTYFHQNGIPHHDGHRTRPPAAIPHYGHHDGGHGGHHHDDHHVHNHYPDGTYKFSHVPAWHGAQARPVSHHFNPRNNHLYRPAGSQSHVGSQLYPGGAAGVGGTSTAGSNGVSGGGGGIIMIADSISNTIQTITTGGYSPAIGANAASGSVIKIINQ